MAEREVDLVGVDDVSGAQVSDTGSPGMNAFEEGIGEHTSNSAVTTMATPVRFVVDGAMVTMVVVIYLILNS